MPEKPKALPFCVVKHTGLPLAEPNSAEIRNQFDTAATDGAMGILLSAKAEKRNVQCSLAPDLDPSDLAEAGWGVLFGAEVSDEIKLALRPLLDRREEECKDQFFRFEGKTGYKAGLAAREWIALRGGSFAGADPRDGVPYYLMIVASPSEIPFEFQYDIDLQWAVGRLWFDKVEDFARYAASIVAQERAQAPLRPREIGLIATRHVYDEATQLFHDNVAVPLNEGKDRYKPIGQAAGFKHVLHMGAAATRAEITGLFQREGGAPALLFTGSHGLGLKIDDAQLTAQQGAIVCADWPGQVAIEDSHILAGSDLPADADLAGMIHFFFACYGAGCPQTDNFSRHLDVAPAIAPSPFIAALPQAMLAHPKGSALAVIGHIERAWSYSFLNEYGLPQLNLFRDVLVALMNGARVGHAMDRANTVWAVYSTRLTELLFAAEHGDPTADPEAIEAVWIARDDARNLVVLGDPAVRLKL